jgi:hypothetical protein
MPGEGSINLTGLTTYEPAKPPGPHGDLFYAGFLEPPNWLDDLEENLITLCIECHAVLHRCREP